jgi:plasmid stability protein
MAKTVSWNCPVKLSFFGIQSVIILFMPDLIIRDVPEDLVTKLALDAGKHHRSREKHTLFLIEEGLKLQPVDKLAIEALRDFSEAVATAIARKCNGKDAAWQDVVEKQERLAEALDRQLEKPAAKGPAREPVQS